MARRRGIKIAKGVRLNFNKTGTSLTVRSKGLFGKRTAALFRLQAVIRAHHQEPEHRIHAQAHQEAGLPSLSDDMISKYLKTVILSF